MVVYYLKGTYAINILILLIILETYTCSYYKLIYTFNYFYIPHSSSSFTPSFIYHL